MSSLVSDEMRGGYLGYIDRSHWLMVSTVLFHWLELDGQDLGEAAMLCNNMCQTG